MFDSFKLSPISYDQMLTIMKIKVLVANTSDTTFIQSFSSVGERRK